MKAHPVWFGEPGHEAQGWLTLPTGTIRGGVVLCPTLGLEAATSYTSLKYVADRLAERGMCSLRFEYTSTANAVGLPDDEGQVAAWLANVVSAVQLLRGRGVADIALVGLRLGALLAATAAAECGPLTSLVLWDPVAAGRAYLRQQSSLFKMHVQSEKVTAPDGVIEGPGFWFTQDTVAALSPLSLANFSPASVHWAPGSAGSSARSKPVQLLVREGQLTSKLIRQLIDDPAVEHRIVAEQEAMLDRYSWMTRIPVATIEAMVDSISSGFADVPAWRADPSAPEASEVHIQTANGTVVETVVRLGTSGQPAFVSEPLDGVTRGEVVFVAASREPSSGPGALWVNMARDAAALGYRCIRFDRKYVGESDPASDASPPLYSQDTVQNVRDMFVAIEDRWRAGEKHVPRSVVAMCSGSWLTAMCSDTLQDDTLYLVNHGLWNVSTIGTENLIPPGLEEEAPSGQASDSRRTALRRGWGQRIRQHLPYFLWRLLSHVLRVSLPETVLARATARGQRAVLLFGAPDAAKFERLRGPEGARRLQRAGRSIEMRTCDALDHALFRGVGRHWVSQTVLDDLAEQARRSSVSTTVGT